MTSQDEIIILHYTRFQEKSIILHTLSSDKGRCSLMVRNASRDMAFFQPLNILECELTANPHSSLSNAKDFHDAAALLGIRTSAGKNAISMFMAEMVYRAVKEGCEEPGLYEWLKGEILLLNAMESDFANFHLRFLLDFASAMGFCPSYESMLPFTGEYTSAVMDMAGCDFAAAMLVKLTGSQRSAICARLLKFLEFHLESPLHIRSLSVLAELF